MQNTTKHNQIIIEQFTQRLDRMGIDVHLQGNEVHFAVPIFVVVGEKLA